MARVIASTYEVIKEIGSGGGGVVYLARHLRLDKKVVLKADKRKVTTRPELLRREVDVLKNLNHPNIPRVYDFFVEDDTVYTAMDYVEGESLDKALERQGKFPQAQVIGWAIQLLDALAYLHSPTHGDPPKGFIHSDIKPANLMLRPDGSICLIDFNIALALGEENLVGRSAGYASPEHYGLDYSTDDVTDVAAPPQPMQDRPTVYVENDEITEPASIGTETGGSTPVISTSKRVHMVMPDVRSDIYSTGATLYHLLCGTRPARDAKQVAPLTAEQCSPQVAAIINKAMQPNPDRRYQTANEMRAAFANLHRSDPRTKRLHRERCISTSLCAALLCLGTGSAFVGLKRMQMTEQWLKLAEYSQNALREGDTTAAINYARQAFPNRVSPLIPEYVPQAQAALTDALGVYNLEDTYYSAGTITLPSSPLMVTMAPGGATAACVYAGTTAVIDTQNCSILAELPANPSARAEAKYLNDNILIYSGQEGICAYDIAAGAELWRGDAATAVAISEDGTTVAALDGEASKAKIYDAHSGALQGIVDFGGRHQQLPVNDIFADPQDDLFALSADGNLLAVSFSDGSLQMFDCRTGEIITIFDETYGYLYYSGGFSGQYFAFSAAKSGKSVMAVIDTKTMEQTGGFESEHTIRVLADAEGVFVQTQNLFVRLDPVTGEQTPMVTTSKGIGSFAQSEGKALITTADTFEFYNSDATLAAEFPIEGDYSFVAFAHGTAVIADRNMPVLRLLTYENHPEAQLFAYDGDYPHAESRISADGQTAMLFDYTGYRIYDRDGNIVEQGTFPNAEQEYDQQYRRADGNSVLEVTYYDGTLDTYDAATGSLIKTQQIDAPNADLYEEFTTNKFRVTSPLHGTPTVYDLQSGKEIAQLESDDYLTYFTQLDGCVMAQYMTTDGDFYGELLDDQCRVLAYLPNLCDAWNSTLVFDYSTGDLRQTHIYTIEELLALADQRLDTG